MTERVLSVEAAHGLAVRVLERHGTSGANAGSVAAALVAAEVDGQAGHGLSRLPSYAGQAASGKVDGRATPTIVDERGGAIRIDAACGFAFPALDLAIDELAVRAPGAGIVAASVFRSHHFGQAGRHVERLADRGLLALAFGNSPKAIAPWGGSRALFGTNPIAFAAPRRESEPLLVDLSLSRVARGKVMVAAQDGRAIPEGWALDSQGNPTTDAKAALQGTMLPMGEAKGAALVLMVEVLAAALSGANFGFEASSFFDAEGKPPGVGQFLLALDPGVFSGGAFHSRLDTLIDAMLAEPGVRLPGARRAERRALARRDGIVVAGSLLDSLERLAD